GHLAQHAALLVRGGADRGDEIGDEVGAALILVLDVRPFRLGIFLGGRDRIDAAGRKGHDDGGEYGMETTAHWNPSFARRGERRSHSSSAPQREADMLKEFREFIARGNVLDLAVAVNIGAA